MEPPHVESNRCDWGSLRAETPAAAVVAQEEKGRRRKKFCASCCKCSGPSPAVQFGLRFSFALTCASLFVLIPFPPGNANHDYWPQGSWVFTTVVLCCWFPSQPVAASVVQKTYHRILGTSVGAMAGLAIGFCVTAFPHDANLARGLFLGSVTSLLCFLWGFAAVHFSKWFSGYNYAAVLVPMTYGIVVWPFYLSHDGESEWKRGAFRIANILIGCVISGLASILVFPKSTSQAIEEKAASQIQRAGKTSQAVLQTAMEKWQPTTNTTANGATSTRRTPLKLSELVRHKVSNQRNQSQQETPVYDSYMAAMQECLAVRNLFALLDYDPLCQHQQNPSMEDAAVNIARTFRIQTTVVLLDSIIRNDEGHHFRAEQLETFARAGKIIHSILTQPAQQSSSSSSSLDGETRDHQIFELVSILAQVRQDAIEAARDMRPLTEQEEEETGVGVGLDLEVFVNQLQTLGGQPLCGQSATILFLELVEHLILRVLRLYFAGNLHLSKSQKILRKQSPGDDFGIEGDAGDHDDDDGE